MSWFKKAVLGPIGLSPIVDKAKGAWDDLRGKDELRAAEARRAQGDDLLDQQLSQINDIQRQFKQYYEPLVRQQSDRLQQGPRYEEAANRARDEFGGAFDQSQLAAQMSQRRNGMDPTSAAAQRIGEDSAFNRSLGLANAANRARTEEDDRHWARSLSFASGGRGLSAQVAQMLGGQANANYGVADQHAQQAGNNLELFGRLGGAAFSAFGGGGGLLGGLGGGGGSPGASPAGYVAGSTDNFSGLPPMPYNTGGSGGFQSTPGFNQFNVMGSGDSSGLQRPYQ